MTHAEQRLRRFLLGVAGFILAATIVELLLDEHTENGQQLIPFVLCGAGVLAIAGAFVSQRRAVMIALYVVMIAVALGGLLGVYLHVAGNIAFEHETNPRLASGDVTWDAIRGASPLLAPCILILAATLALAAVHRSPGEPNEP